MHVRFEPIFQMPRTSMKAKHSSTSWMTVMVQLHWRPKNRVVWRPKVDWQFHATPSGSLSSIQVAAVFYLFKESSSAGTFAKSCEEFIDGMLRCKGSARAIDQVRDRHTCCRFQFQVWQMYFNMIFGTGCCYFLLASPDIARTKLVEAVGFELRQLQVVLDRKLSRRLLWSFVVQWFMHSGEMHSQMWVCSWVMSLI